MDELRDFVRSYWLGFEEFRLVVVETGDHSEKRPYFKGDGSALLRQDESLLKLMVSDIEPRVDGYNSPYLYIGVYPEDDYRNA